MGRPLKKFDYELFEKLCGIQCTAEEICAVMEISQDTLVRRTKLKYKKTFADVFKQKREAGKSSLRRTQWVKAMEGSIPLLIFLGKNYLGQSDKNELEQSKPVEISLNYNLEDCKS